ncbi:hypothetical protein [Streptomyces atroolivaceus]|uniref:hypothetical protein n=1 Tax=Streptomyces atroolivaceus TaxID=66869 RepID=UPI00369496E0
MAQQPSWEPLPTRMEQPRRGVKPTAVRAPRRPPSSWTTSPPRGRALAELRREGEENSTAELQARVAVRQAVCDACAEGIEHSVQLAVLADAGLPDTASLAAVGWEPVLLAAIDRGRPSKAAVAV